jgi:solute:Na+ symporter, SSS family
MTTEILALIIGYLVILLIIGFRAGRHVIKEPESFYVADRKLNWLQEGLSIFSTAMPGAALLGTVGQFYKLGSGFLGYAFGYVLLAPALYCLVGSRFRRLGARFKWQTQADFLREYFGGEHFSSKALGWISTVMGIVFLIPYLSISPIAVALTMQTYLGIPYSLGVVIFVIIATSYAAYGGLRSVANTDVYHGILLLLFFVAFTVGTIAVAGGFAHVATASVNRQYLSVGSPAIWALLFVPWIVQTGFNPIVAPDRSLRMFSVRDDMNLRRGAILMGTTLGFAALAFFTVSLALHLLAPGTSNSDKAVLDGLTNGAGWLIPFFIVSVWASSLAVVSMQLLTVANLFTKDVLPLFNRATAGDPAGQKDEGATSRVVRVGRIVMVVTAGLAVGFAVRKPIYIFSIVGTVLNFWTQLGVVFLFALFWRRTTRLGALSGVLIGIAVVVISTWVVPAPSVVLPGTIGALANSLTILTVSLLAKGAATESSERTAMRMVVRGV